MLPFPCRSGRLGRQNSCASLFWLRTTALDIVASKCFYHNLTRVVWLRALIKSHSETREEFLSCRTRKQDETAGFVRLRLHLSDLCLVQPTSLSMQRQWRKLLQNHSSHSPHSIESSYNRRDHIKPEPSTLDTQQSCPTASVAP